jgi:hypothetical protein
MGTNYTMKGPEDICFLLKNNQTISAAIILYRAIQSQKNIKCMLENLGAISGTISSVSMMAEKTQIKRLIERESN